MSTGLDALKTTSKKVVHKVAKGTRKFIGNKTEDAVAQSNDNKIVKTKPLIDTNSRNIEEITIPPEEREEILN